MQSHTEEIFSFFRSQGTIAFQAWLDKAGYRPGEIIVVTLHVQNNCKSNPEISRKIFLRQNNLFIAEGETRRKKIDHLMYFYSNDEKNTIEIPIPKDAPSSLFNDLFRIEYELILKFNIKAGLSDNAIRFALPVVIGEDPLKYAGVAREVFGSTPLTYFETFAPPSVELPPNPFYPDVPPPSYEEAMKEAEAATHGA